MGRVKKWLAGLLALLVVMAGVPMYAEIEVKAKTYYKVGDYSYEINEDGKSVTIERYDGNGGDVTIPSEVMEKKGNEHR